MSPLVDGANDKTKAKWGYSKVHLENGLYWVCSGAMIGKLPPRHEPFFSEQHSLVLNSISIVQLPTQIPRLPQSYIYPWMAAQLFLLWGTYHYRISYLADIILLKKYM